MPTPKTLTAHGLASTLAGDTLGQRESSADANGLRWEPSKGSDIPDFSSSDRLGWLQLQYSNLMRTLLREVSAPTYEIAEDSRSRIKANIIVTQRREMYMLSQGKYPGLPSLVNSRTTQMQHLVNTGPRVKEYPTSMVNVDQASAPVQHFSTQHSMRCAARSTANDPSSVVSVDSIAPSSNRLDESHTATQLRPPEAQTWTPQNDELRLQPHTYIPPPPQSEASLRLRQVVLHSRTMSPAQEPSFHSEASTLPKYDRTLEARFGRENSPIQREQLHECLHECPTPKEGRIQPQKESFNGILKDDGIEDCAEHIVDKLLATWTTLHLHASQIDPRHGSLAETAY